MSAPVPMSTIAEQDVIVLDPGSGYIKAGFAGEDTPRVVIPSVAINLANQAVPTEVSHAFKDLDWVFGYDALDALRLGLEATGKQTLAVIRPIERGVIKDWEAFELLCEHVICVSLGVREPALTRCDLVEHLFKRLAPPSVYLFNSAALALFSTGRTTGVVLDIGEGVTSAVPVFEGLALSHAVQILDVAGADVTQLLLASLAEVGALEVLGNAHSQLDLARTLKERVCVCAPAAAAADAAAGSAVSVSAGDAPPSVGAADFELPDGSVLRLDASLRAAAAEVLFSTARAVPLVSSGQPALLLNPSSLFPVVTSTSAARPGLRSDDHSDGGGAYDVITMQAQRRHKAGLGGGGSGSSGAGPKPGDPPVRHFPLPLSLSSIPVKSPALQLLAHTPAARPADGAAEMLVAAVGACDAALRPDLFNCVVLAGGGSLLPGLPLRVKQELLARTHGRAPVNIVLDMSRHWAAWVGGSMFASMPTFQLCRVTRAEFEADKASVHKKYF